MEFTGERFLPELNGSIELEHLHRYLAVCSLAKDKDVLDIACGEGYGTAMLGRGARSIIGVDIAEQAINHALKKYSGDKITFRNGSCAAIPLDDQSVDLVISFETIEHHAEHHEMMREIKRVLRPEGILVISSPDKLNYTDLPSFHNEHHVKELYREEFVGLINQYFVHSTIYGQKIAYGSAIFSETAHTSIRTFEYLDNAQKPYNGFPKPVYLIAMASDLPFESMDSAFLDQEIEDSELTTFWRDLMRQKDSALLEAEALRVSQEYIHKEQLKSSRMLFESKLEQFNAAIEQNAMLRDLQARSDALLSLETEKADLANSSLVSTQLQLQQSLLEHANSSNTINEIYSSTSWKITRPLRSIKSTLVEQISPLPIGGKIFNASRAIFRRAPLPLVIKDRLRFWVIARSGFFRPRKTPAPALNKDGNPLAVQLSNSQVFKEQLSAALLKKQNNWIPRREKMLSLEPDELLATAKGFNFRLPTAPRVSILIPVFGNIALTLECLKSIGQSTSNTTFEIIIADDASTDATEKLLSNRQGIKYQRNSKNLGFLLNCNSALKIASGEFVVYLNNDVQVTDGWLDELLACYESRPNVGAVGPKIVYPSGHLQEAGVALKHDGTAVMVGLNKNPSDARFNYPRTVAYCSGACLLVKRDLLLELDGFDPEFAPAYCEDTDLCIRILRKNFEILYAPKSKIIHHLSKTTAAKDNSEKLRQITLNQARLFERWEPVLEELSDVKVIAFYLPQFHCIAENDLWWGKGFTEWTNVRKAKINFIGQMQPRVPTDLGYYDLNDPSVMQKQTDLARRYGVDAFCFYYYWFNGKRLLEMPVERLLLPSAPDFPYCLCWANENWSRRWDGKDHEVLIDQHYSIQDDLAVITDLIRHFNNPNYLRVNGKPHILVYRVNLFPDFAATALRWREACRTDGIGEIYISMVESHDLVHANSNPGKYGCDAAVEFPPLNMAEQQPPSGEIVNPSFAGGVASYSDTALRFCTREQPNYVRFPGVMPGWDNTARRQDNGFVFENPDPEVFQAWLEHNLGFVREQYCKGERMVFINAWNEWAEGAYLEPDSVFGHAFLEAVKNAKEAERLIIKVDGNS